MKAKIEGSRFAALLGAAMIVPLSGCGVVATQLHVSDDSRVMGSARVVKRLGGGPGGPGVELEVASFKAQGSQNLTGLETVTLGAQSISGPATLQHSARVEQGHLVYNHLLFAGRAIEMEWFVGAAWTRTRWESTSSNPTDPRLSSQTNWSGPTGGALGRLQLAPMLSLEARYAGAIATGGAVDTGSRTLAEAALAVRPPGGLVLRGGYAESRSWARPEFGSSELSVRARGPFVNLGLEF